MVTATTEWDYGSLGALNTRSSRNMPIMPTFKSYSRSHLMFLLLPLVLTSAHSIPASGKPGSNENLATTASAAYGQQSQEGLAQLSGTYLGIWQSPLVGDGEFTLRVTVSGHEMRAEIVVIGSPTGFKGDTLTTKNLKSMGAGVWTVEFSAEHTSLTARGIFKEGTFIGDYDFRPKHHLRHDRGQWLLKKQ